MTKLPSAGSKDTVLMAISSGPSFKYTSHKKDAVAGYTLYAFIDNAEATAEHTFFNGQPAYLLDQTTQPKCFGDAAGRGGGVRSGTIGGEVKPTSGSSTIFIEGKALIREGDTCTMNNGNVKGKYVTVDASEAYDIMAKWADEATAQALKDGGFWAMSELIYQAEADALWINVKGDEKAYYEGLKKIAERDMVALDILTMGYPIGKVGSFAAKAGAKGLGRFITPKVRIGPYKGSTSSSIERYNKFLNNTTQNTTGSGVRNFSKPSSTSRNKDWELLTKDAQSVRNIGKDRKLAIFPDKSKAIIRPSTSGPRTIEIQRPDGSKIVEIRYARD